MKAGRLHPSSHFSRGGDGGAHGTDGLTHPDMRVHKEPNSRLPDYTSAAARARIHLLRGCASNPAATHEQIAPNSQRIVTCGRSEQLTRPRRSRAVGQLKIEAASQVEV